MKPLTRKQLFAWLMDGLAIEQPGAIKVSKNDGILRRIRCFHTTEIMCKVHNRFRLF